MSIVVKAIDFTSCKGGVVNEQESGYVQTA